MSNAWQVTKTLLLRLRFLFVFLAIGLVVGNWEAIMNRVDRWTRGKAEDGVKGEHEWYCPMHPTVVRDNDKEKCPVCNMGLSRRKRGESTKLPPGVLDRLQLTGIRMRQAGVAVEEIGYRRLVREVRTVGTLEWDERKVFRPGARVGGRVDELHVDFAGRRVKQGDPLYQLYSPDLVTTQEEYLAALKALDEVRARGDEASVERAKRLADSSRERLVLWGITEDQIAEVEKGRKARTHLTIVSPASGVVIEKALRAGQYLQVGESPFTVADDGLLWMQAHVFERDLGLVATGQLVEVVTEAYPAEKFGGTVAFIAPGVEAETRTVKARVEIPNPERKLKAGMFVTAVLRIPLGRQGEVFYGC
jgi:Cu(I)/Ag(I) efflux system membrane fusion protein